MGKSGRKKTNKTNKQGIFKETNLVDLALGKGHKGPKASIDQILK